MNLIPTIQTLLQDNSLDMELEVDIELCTPSWATKVKLEEEKTAPEELIITEESVANHTNVW
jgi:hypothetical protein